METIQELEAQIERLEKKLNFSYYHTTPIGAVLVFATPKAPMGWLVCNGQEYRIEEYKELYKTIGNAFNTTETPEGFFRVPDLQGQFIRGWDEEGNIDPERAFGSNQIDTLQGHRHEVKSCSEAGSHSHYVGYCEYPTYERDGLLSTTYRHKHVDDFNSSSKVGNRSTDYDGTHTHDIEIGSAQNDRYGFVNVANETRPKNIALLYCIKAK